jgi:hypothetical protein
MPNEHATIQSFDQLQTENLRLSVFFAPGHERVVDPHWWTELTGVDPETRTSQPGRGILQEAGAVGERYGLILNNQPGRADWLLVAKQEEGVPPTIKWAGPLSETLAFFCGLMNKWLTTAPPISRLAFGAAVHIPTESREEAYQKLIEYLPRIWIDPAGSTDFFYQINRPRNSLVVDGLRIHRLSKWASAIQASIQLPIGQLAATQTAIVQKGPISCRIEVDINTDPEFVRPFSGAESGPIFEELTRLGAEIISEGDIQ